MTDHTTHDLAIARAERDAWQSTCEELHRTIAGRDVEIEAHLGRCEAADQRARSLDAALTAEREAGKGLVAQAEALRADSRHHAAIAAQNATLASERDAAIAERDACARPVLTVERLKNAARKAGWAAPVKADDDAMCESILAALGAVTLPSPDRLATLESHLRDIHSGADDAEAKDAWLYCAELINAEARALAKLSPAPAPTFDAAFLRRVLVATKHGPNGKGGPGPCDAACVKCEAELMAKAAPAREVAPTLVAVSDEELAREHEDGRLHAQLRVELAELRARPVLTEDLLRGALDAHGYAGLTRKLFAHLGPVTLPLAELRARPVLTVEALDAAAESCGYGSAVIPGFAAQMFAALGPVTLPSPDRAEELTAAIYDAVERAERAMTPGPWAAKIYTTHVAGTSQETQWHEAIAGGPSSGTVVCETEWSVFEDVEAIGAANIRGIVALRNAAPALIAEVRALRAAAEEREADMHARIRAGYDKTVADAWRAEVAKRDAEIARLRALGLEACDRLDAVARGARGRDAEEARATADRIRKELTRG